MFFVLWPAVLKQPLHLAMSTYDDVSNVSEEDDLYIRTIVVTKHDPTDETQLTLKVNDIVIVLEKDETGWWGGQKEGDTETGWFPGSCVREIEPKSRRALETGTASPVRQSYAVASPHRTSAASTQSMTMTHGDERKRLIMEVERLNRQKEALEEKLREHVASVSELQNSKLRLEKQVKEQEKTLRTERDTKRDLERKNEELQRQVQILDQRLNAAIRENTVADMRSQTPQRETRDVRDVRDTPQRHAEVAFHTPRIEHPRCGASGASYPSGEEAPPIGTVKQIRDTFERLTPRAPREQRDIVGQPRVTPRETDLDFGLSPIQRGHKDPRSFFPNLEASPAPKVPTVGVIPPR